MARVLLRIPNDLHDRIKALAENSDTSVSAIASDLIVHALDEVTEASVSTPQADELAKIDALLDKHNRRVIAKVDAMLAEHSRKAS